MRRAGSAVQPVKRPHTGHSAYLSCYFRRVHSEAVVQRQARVYRALPEYRQRLHLLAGRKGYRLVHCELAGVNAFFVHTGEPGEFLAADDVRRRGPNYYLGSFGHPPGDPDRRYERV